MSDIPREGPDRTTTNRSATDAIDPGPAVVVLFNSSLGEVDWLLPVLHRLHEKQPATRIIAYVGDRQLQENLAAATFRLATLAEVATILHHGDDDLAGHVRPADVALLLKTDDPDNEVSRDLRARFPRAKVTLFPSSTALLTRADDPVEVVHAHYDAVTPLTGNDPRQGYLPCDLVLAGSPHMLPFYTAVARADTIHAGGVPRYGAWWIAAQQDDPELPGSAEQAFVSRHARAVLFVIRGPHWLYQAEDDYRDLMTTFLAETKQRPDTAFIVKPHAGQDVDEVAAWLAAAADDNVMLSHRSLLQLSGLVELVVSMFSSGVLDALSVGTPVVEYYRYHDRQPVLEFRRSADGAMTSLYEDLGLVQNLPDAAALATCLDDLERYWTAAVSAEQMIAFRTACTARADAAAAAADELIDLMEKTGHLMPEPVGALT